MPRIQLPPSLDRNRHTLDRELERARRMTPEERLQALSRVCRASVRIAELAGRRAELATRREPLPPSTLAALERLRREASGDG